VEKKLSNHPFDTSQNLAELLDRLPAETTISRALYLFDDEKEPKLGWDVKHHALTFFIVRDDLGEAVRAFTQAVEERGLRPLLEARASSFLK
jgi:hypothetical protein